MAEGEPSEEEVGFSELVGFLADPKTAVQRLAAEGLLEHTGSLDFIEYCKKKPRAVARALLRLAERAEADLAKADVSEGTRDGESGRKATSSEDKKERMSKLEAMESAAAGSAALKALVNLSAVQSVCAELVDMNAARRCCEALRGGWLEGRSELAHWHAMLLANLSNGEAGQKALIAEESHLRFLFSAYVAKSRPPPRDGFDDPMLCLGKVINNVCALEAGRKIFANVNSVALLAIELGDRPRRPDVLSAFRNLCQDDECHEAVIGTDFLARIARFLYPWETAAPDRRAQLPEELQEVLKKDGAILTKEEPDRYAAAQCILGLCLGKEARRYLRECGGYELCRAWHVEESSSMIRTALESCVPFLKQTEEELEEADRLLAQSDALEAADAEGPQITEVTDGYVAAEQPPAAPAQVGGEAEK